MRLAATVGAVCAEDFAGLGADREHEDRVGEACAIVLWRWSRCRSPTARRGTVRAPDDEEAVILPGAHELAAPVSSARWSVSALPSSARSSMASPLGVPDGVSARGDGIDGTAKDGDGVATVGDAAIAAPTRGVVSSTPATAATNSVRVRMCSPRIGTRWRTDGISPPAATRLAVALGNRDGTDRRPRRCRHAR